MSETVLRLQPNLVDPSPFNRATPLSKLGPLIESIRAQGQLQAGRVRRHPRMPGRYECLYGHRRLVVQRFLNGEFIAVLHEEELSDADIVCMQLTENLQRSNLTPFEIADAVRQFTIAKGCKQYEAAELLGLAESVVSKAMSIDENLIPDYRALVESGEIGKSNAHLLSMLTPEKQCQVDPTMKRDSLAKVVKKLNGRPGRKERTTEIKYGGVTAKVTGDTLESLKAFAAKIVEAIKKLERDGNGPEYLPGLMK